MTQGKAFPTCKDSLLFQTQHSYLRSLASNPTPQPDAREAPHAERVRKKGSRNLFPFTSVKTAVRLFLCRCSRVPWSWLQEQWSRGFSGSSFLVLFPSRLAHWLSSRVSFPVLSSAWCSSGSTTVTCHWLLRVRNNWLTSCITKLIHP